MGLSRAGVEIELWTTWRAHDPPRDDPQDRRLEEAGVKLRYFPVHPWNLLGERYAYSPALGIALTTQMPPVDLVHIHALWQYPNSLAAKRCRRGKIPYLLSPCGALDPYGLRRRALFKWIYGFLVERENLARASLIHYTSAMEQRLAWAFGVHPPSVVIPRFISLEDLPEPPPGLFRNHYPETQDRRILLFLGRLHAKKRVDIVARAFTKVAYHLKDIHLVIAGPDDGAGSQVLQIVKKAGLTDRMTLTGLLSGNEKWAALRESGLFLLPSEDENFGVAALEAMACGIPVLISPNVALAEPVTRVRAGSVVSGDADSWAATIEQFLRDPSRLQAMGKAGRRLVVEEFSRERVMAKWLDTYMALVRRHPQGFYGT